MHERDIGPRRGANQELLDVILAGALFLGQFHIEPYFVASALLSNGLGTKESVTHLTGNVLGGQSQDLPLRLDAEVELLFAGRIAVVDVGYDRIARQHLGKPGAGLVQGGDVSMTQFDAQRGAGSRAAPVRFETQGFESRHLAHLLPPAARHLPGR